MNMNVLLTPAQFNIINRTTALNGNDFNVVAINGEHSIIPTEKQKMGTRFKDIVPI